MHLDLNPIFKQEFRCFGKLTLITINITKIKIFPITINFVNTYKIKVKRLFNIQRPPMCKMLFPAIPRAFILSQENNHFIEYY